MFEKKNEGLDNVSQINKDYVIMGMEQARGAKLQGIAACISALMPLTDSPYSIKSDAIIAIGKLIAEI